MPSPKKCAAKFPKGSKAYKNCVSYGGTKTQGQSGGGPEKKNYIEAVKKRRKAYKES